MFQLKFSKMNEYSSALSYYHVAVFLFGFSPILGKLISYGSLMLVWHRMVISFFIYLLLPEVRHEIIRLGWRERGIFFALGILLCLSWITFYASIKLGDSASITLACRGAGAFFTAIFEPIFLKVNFSWRDLSVGIVVLLGILQIYYALPHESAAPDIQYGWAVAVGLLSSMIAALFYVLNKLYINESTPLTIGAIEMFAGAVVLTVVVPFLEGDNIIWIPRFDWANMTVDTIRSGPWDLVWIVVLSVLCTNLTFYLSNKAQIHLRAFTVNLLHNLELLYGVVLGAVVFHEHKTLNYHFYIGTFIVLAAIFGSSFLPKEQKEHDKDKSESSTEDVEGLSLNVRTSSANSLKYV